MAKPLAKIVALLTPKRRWAQFSLLTLFLVVTVLCVWLSVVVNRAHRQRDAVAAIEEAGGHVEYEVDQALPKRFLRVWLPKDYTARVTHVGLGGGTNDSALVHLQGLPGLRFLTLRGAEVTDDGLKHLRTLTELQRLVLGNTQVTDIGLSHLRELTALRVLWLDSTPVTDDGLTYLKGLTGLEELRLHYTQVTEGAFPECGQAAVRRGTAVL